ncbi:MAG TPA: heavy metal-binding domain-containing protein [Phycisphaerales bacterium]|nr:heavy metal-binding domain-containing protein [Phycisphaerales bacterium]
MEHLLNLVIFLILLVVGFAVGMVTERQHLKNLALREAAVKGMLVTGSRTFPAGGAATRPACMVVGHACISSDYFKTFLATIRKIIGGEMRTYESLCSRARREAMLRMVEQARSMGYDAVCNVRLDGADIGKSGERGGNKGITMVGIMATGTAYNRAGATPGVVAPVRIDEA